MDIGPPPHIDRNEDIGFYVLEGQFTFSFEENEIKAKTGDFVFMPRGLKHWLRSDSDKVGRMLVIASPAGFEKFYDATGTPVEDDSKMPLPPYVPGAHDTRTGGAKLRYRDVSLRPEARHL